MEGLWLLLAKELPWKWCVGGGMVPMHGSHPESWVSVCLLWKLSENWVCTWAVGNHDGLWFGSWNGLSTGDLWWSNHIFE
jgi:hypothetical protein